MKVDMKPKCAFTCVAGAVALHQPQIQSEEEELQELWDRHSEPVQGDVLSRHRRRRRSPSLQADMMLQEPVM